jgi:NAD(P)-dependent dehydrogenase (short-subunit alcohol dehydrogenase family)
MTALLVVSGTAGIGLDIARRYAGEGWSVILAGRDGAHAKSVAGELGGDTRGIALDLSEPEQVTDAVADIEAVDHIVLSAISRDRNNIADYDIAAARYLAIMKLVGYTAVVSALRDRQTQDGSVVVFGGRAKDRPYPGSTTVSTVNGGVSGMVKTLAWELAPIRVNAIHPGITGDSPYWDGKPAAVLEGHRSKTITQKLATMDEIVAGTRFLLENESVDGIDLVVDNGRLMF